MGRQHVRSLVYSFGDDSLCSSITTRSGDHVGEIELCLYLRRRAESFGFFFREAPMVLLEELPRRQVDVGSNRFGGEILKIQLILAQFVGDSYLIQKTRGIGLLCHCRTPYASSTETVGDIR